MVSSMAHPEVLQKTAQLAKKAGHQRDRELFFRLTGSLPDKKGSSINIFNQNAAVQNPKLPELNQPRTRFKGFDDEVIEMSRQLEAPFVPAEEDDVSS